MKTRIYDYEGIGKADNMYRYTELNTEGTTMTSTYCTYNKKSRHVQSTASQLPVEAHLPSGLYTYPPPCRDSRKIR
jgi:hypothetical protein